MAQDKEPLIARWSRLKQEQARDEAPPAAGEGSAPPALPPVDALTSESDFSGFMHPKVGDALRRVALKKLFADPHFNVPDPYEAYSGDWTGGGELTEEALRTLNQARSVLFRNEEQPPAQQVGAPQQEQERAPEDQAKDDDDAGKPDA
ncbi:MAG: DUF3306 domain-containing protein [Burkholderiales bacterium]